MGLNFMISRVKSWVIQSFGLGTVRSERVILRIFLKECYGRFNCIGEPFPGYGSSCSEAGKACEHVECFYPGWLQQGSASRS